MINDWIPETRSLYRRLVKAGFKPVSVDWPYEDGVVTPRDEAHALDLLTAADESILTVIHTGEKFRILLVLGNEPGALVGHYFYHRDSKMAGLLDSVTRAHYENWRGREQPKKFATSPEQAE